LVVWKVVGHVGYTFLVLRFGKGEMALFTFIPFVHYERLIPFVHFTLIPFVPYERFIVTSNFLYPWLGVVDCKIFVCGTYFVNALKHVLWHW
jgi:hypothetical protein